ncbi:hypothetical protein [Treponema sp. Marseille-Q4130]|uniref:hypothetical protein n=1 Tax=Treponema sp. Marseille-Q4130 TaxID=2766702 RepID=UPI00165268D0|nr:hypothetical protein [Treponema sp. Marseille-Q4130]MBC6719561.1 hypothetical protein [Treponema sp. Marseille-Q4130]
MVVLIKRYRSIAPAVLLFSAFLSGAYASKKGAKSALPLPAAEGALETPSPADIEQNEFLTRISGIALNIVSFPKQTVKHVPFPSAYTLLVKDVEGKEVPGMPITVSYPASRTDDSIVYDEIVLTTDENGRIEFMPEVPTSSFNAVVTFYPTPVNSNPETVKAARAASVTAPYKVRTDSAKKSGILYVFDFDENGRALTNSRYILRDFINSGVRSGNSPIPSPNYLNQSIASLYKATRAIVGDSSGFMVSGSIKFAAPSERKDDGTYACTLVADIVCIDMQNGAVLYKTRQTASESGTSQYLAVEACRKKIASQTVQAILYGM